MPLRLWPHFIRLRILAVAVAITIPCIAAAQVSSEPRYLKHRTDPVQQIFSRALVGFALNQKCLVLSQSVAADYELRLTRASDIFQGYVVAQHFVASPEEALEYIRAMATGSARFAALNECDAPTKEAVASGHQTARDFVPLLREMFEAPSQKR